MAITRTLAIAADSSTCLPWCGALNGTDWNEGVFHGTISTWNTLLIFIFIVIIIYICDCACIDCVQSIMPCADTAR